MGLGNTQKEARQSDELPYCRPNGLDRYRLRPDMAAWHCHLLQNTRSLSKNTAN